MWRMLQERLLDISHDYQSLTSEFPIKWQANKRHSSHNPVCSRLGNESLLENDVPVLIITDAEWEGAKTEMDPKNCPSLICNLFSAANPLVFMPMDVLGLLPKTKYRNEHTDPFPFALNGRTAGTTRRYFLRVVFYACSAFLKDYGRYPHGLCWSLELLVQ